jgi:hypothetical protein
VTKLTESEYQINIRELDQTDIPVIIHLDEKITGLHRPEMWESEIQHYLDSNSICLVAEMQDQVIGFMIGSLAFWNRKWGVD